MTWVFAILIVLAMGGIAVVAAGRGTPMAEVYDDRPDATVPAAGPLVADDLRRVRFSIALRGYRMSEVDALLDRLASQLEERPASAPETPVDTSADTPAETPAERRAASYDPPSDPPAQPPSRPMDGEGRGGDQKG